MITYNTVKEVYARNYGSEQLFKRNYCNNLTYTEGLMDFQQSLNAHWVIDNVISYMPKVLQAYKENEFTFFVVEIAVNQKQKLYINVFIK